MPNSPLSTPGKSLLFAVAIILVSLNVMETLSDPEALPLQREDAGETQVSEPVSTIAAGAMTDSDPAWSSPQADDQATEFEIAEYAPAAEPPAAEDRSGSTEGELAFSGRRPIPVNDIRTVN